MSIQKTYYALISGHQLATITLQRHGIAATISTYGASLINLVLRVAQKQRSVILHLDHPQDYLKERTFLGATVGRVAGRLVGNVWHRQDHDVYLPANEGPNHLHGGPAGLDQQWFVFTTHQANHYDEVRLETVDYAGHNGYPGTMRIEVVYRLNDDHQLKMTIHATTDAPTLFNPTNHTYFALDGLQSTIENAQVKVAADYYQPLTTGHLPIGTPQSVAKTVFDLRKGQALSTILNAKDSQIILEHGLNHPFLLNQHSKAAQLVSGDRHVSLIVSTNAPSLVLYSANHFDGQGICAKIPRFGGLTFEAQQAPTTDTNLAAITLLPGERFQRRIVWSLQF